jgi:hypothetical protein
VAVTRPASVSTEWSFASVGSSSTDLEAFVDHLLDFVEACAFPVLNVAGETDATEMTALLEFEVVGSTAHSAFEVAHRLAMGAAQHAARCHWASKRLTETERRDLARVLSSPEIRFRELYDEIGELPIAVEG